jgi:signal transduction histidine kinase
VKRWPRSPPDRMGKARLALSLAAVGFGVLAEAIADPEHVVLDSLAGFTLVGVGLATWGLRPRNWSGPILLAGGVSWFAGSFGGWPLYVHRGVLAHLVLVYPGVRAVPRSRLERAAIVGAYGYAAIPPLAGDDRATLVFAASLTLLTARRVLVARGRERRQRAVAATATFAFVSALACSSLVRLLDAGLSATALLTIYDVAVSLVALLLGADLLLLRWTRSAVAGVVVDVGNSTARTLTARLAQSLGDPSLIVGYWVPEQHGYVDENGRSVDVSGARHVTSIGDGAEPLAVLLHDVGVLNDSELVAGVSAAVRLAMSNVRLRADIQRRTAEVAASRRRIVEAADEQRRRLERELRQGAGRRVARVAALLSGDEPELTARVKSARTQLHNLARGIHSATLTERGLTAAARELVDGLPVSVDVHGPPLRFPPAVEAAAYFACSEALANAMKHAAATSIRVRITVDSGSLRVEISDDGVGGADSAGSGLRGLGDRLEAIGGNLRVESAPNAGTTVICDLPFAEPRYPVFLQGGENPAP